MAWFEQKRDSSGNISFVQHMIMDDYATAARTPAVSRSPSCMGRLLADMDGDGIPDFIVGKRYWAHCDDFFDPDPYGAPVLYLYHTVRDPKAPGGARFVPELINNHSGAGSTLIAVDLNKDGAMILTSTKLGMYIFWGKQGGNRAMSSAAIRH